jgi:hypothetical protein
MNDSLLKGSEIPETKKLSIPPISITSSIVELSEMRSKNQTNASFKPMNSKAMNSSLDQSKASKYTNQIMKITKKIKHDSTSSDKVSEGKEAPFSSIHKALRAKQELEKEQNTSLMNELASKLNFLRGTMRSGLNSISDSDEEINKKPPKKKSTVLEENKSIEIKKNELLERVFWTKEKMEQIRNQLRTAKDKINDKMNKDFGELEELIECDDRDSIV